jgi:aminoglycoside phosphotransferase (APT) family kinase protein
MPAMTLSDQSQPIRADEGIDQTVLDAFLRENLPNIEGDLTVKQFPSGFSNLTYHLTIGTREFVLRRPPFGTKAKSAHDMKREFTILKALKLYYPYCPEAILYTDDASILGCPFYIMERLRGIILRKNLPQGLALTASDMARLCETLLDVLVELHQIDYQKAGLDDIGHPKGYVRRQVEGWVKRFRNARTDDAPDFEDVMTWLIDEMPADTPAPTIIHNDYRFDNVVLDEAEPSQIIGVLDWEMATVGDPLMDLGNTLAYWVQADDPEEFQLMRLMPTHLDGALTRQELVNRYVDKTGRSVDDFSFYSAFGLFRLAVIAQQIYYRYYHGQTKDERFKMLIFGVHVLEKAARRVMNEGFL